MIVLGRISEAFGIQGWVRVQAFGDDPLSWRGMPKWWLCSDPDAADDAWRPIGLRTCRAQGKGIVAAFDGVEDRNGAEALTGLYIGAPRDALPETASGEYYWGDLVGLAVENKAGVALGVVESLVSTGAHDVLQIRAGEVERLIPFVAAYILDVDLEGRRIQVDWEADW